MKKYPVIKKYNVGDRAMFGGLFAISITALTILVGTSSGEPPESKVIKTIFDKHLITFAHIAILCFTISIPFLAFGAERVRIDSFYKFRTHSVYIDIVEGAGLILSLIGLTATIAYFSGYLAIVFILAVFAAISLHSWYEDAMEKVNEEDKS